MASVLEVPVLLYSVQEALDIDSLERTVREYGNSCGIIKLVCSEDTSEIIYDKSLINKSTLQMNQTKYFKVKDLDELAVKGLYYHQMDYKLYNTNLEKYKKKHFLNQKYGNEISHEEFMKIFEDGSLEKIPAPYCSDNNIPGLIETFNFNGLINVSQCGGIFSKGMDILSDFAIPSFYFGLRGTPFGCHQEVMSSISWNMMIEGSKIWYSVSPKDFETVLEIQQNFLPSDCPGSPWHNTCFMDPQFIIERGINVYQTVQTPKTTILAFSKGLHWGGNLKYSFNVGMSYGDIKTWLPNAVKAKVCSMECKKKNS